MSVFNPLTTRKGFKAWILVSLKHTFLYVDHWLVNHMSLRLSKPTEWNGYELCYKILNLNKITNPDMLKNWIFTLIMSPGEKLSEGHTINPASIVYAVFELKIFRAKTARIADFVPMISQYRYFRENWRFIPQSYMWMAVPSVLFTNSWIMWFLLCLDCCSDHLRNLLPYTIFGLNTAYWKVQIFVVVLYICMIYSI